MQCNIDARGKAVRLISGIACSIIAIVLLVLALLDVAGTWAWIVAVVLLLGGLFQVYEGRTGWCVVRAMGFRTPV